MIIQTLTPQERAAVKQAVQTALAAERAGRWDKYGPTLDELDLQSALWKMEAVEVPTLALWPKEAAA